MKLFWVAFLAFGSFSAFSAEVCELSKVAQHYEEYVVLSINCSDKYPSSTFTIWNWKSEGPSKFIHKSQRFEAVKSLYKSGYEEVVSTNTKVERFVKP